MQPTVYFVDDDAAVRDALSLLLSLKGFVSQVFASAETFLETYRLEWRGCLLTDLRIAARPGLSPRTVEVYKARMMEKLDCRNLAEALRLMAEVETV